MALTPLSGAFEKVSLEEYTEDESLKESIEKTLEESFKKESLKENT